MCHVFLVARGFVKYAYFGDRIQITKPISAIMEVNESLCIMLILILRSIIVTYIALYNHDHSRLKI